MSIETKNSTRSIHERMEHDQHILEQVNKALHRSGYDQLRSVRTYCHHGRIVLQGKIPTYYLKQVAQELVRSVSDVRDVDNDLHVVSGH